MPVCSIVVPAFNSASTLERCVESARYQSCADIEILIIDDGSRDNSVEVAERFRRLDSRIEVFRFGENKGKSSAMNFAQDAARGEWIAVLDADDEYDPQRIERLLALATLHKADLVADNQLKVDPFTDAIVGLVFDSKTLGGQLDLHRYLSSVGWKHDYGTLKPIIRKEFITATGLSYNLEARFSQDFYFLLDFFLSGVAYVSNEAFYRYTLPFSPLLRKWTTTGAGAWRHNFEVALKVNESYLEKEPVPEGPEVEGLLRRRSAILKRSLKWSAFKRLLLEEGTKEALIYLIQRPKFWQTALRRLMLGRF